MAERPILMSGAMVRAILDGRKTQTRRVLRDQNPVDLGASMHGAHIAVRPVHDHGRLVGHREVVVTSPYGVPGDRLWVREAWRAPKSWDDTPPRGIDDMERLSYVADEFTIPPGYGRYRHARFMPRRFCRLVLEVTDVRVERLQEISAEDVLAEGVEPPRCEKCGYTRGDCGLHMDHHLCGEPIPAHEASAYATLWDSLNAKRAPWASNPWVWVVAFKRSA